MYLCTCPIHTLVVVAWDNDILKASLMLCFWLLEPEKFKLHTKDIAEVNATGVVYAIPECAEGKLCPHAHFSDVLYYGVGIQYSVCLYARFSQDLRSGQADDGTPLFLCRN